MDNRNSLFSKTVQLACRVLQEQIQNKDSKTQLEREFLEAMGLNTQKPTQDMGEDSLPSSRLFSRQKQKRTQRPAGKSENRTG